MSEILQFMKDGFLFFVHVNMLRDLFILWVALWALWSEFSPNTKTTITLSLARLGIGFGAIILLSKFSDNISTFVLGVLVLIFCIAIIREKQRQ